MSIDSLQSNPWTNPWSASAASQSGTNAAGGSASTGPFAEINQLQANFGSSAPNSAWAGQSSVGTNDASLSPANPLQSLASDIQAMLIQAQDTAASGVGTAQAATPQQSVAADLQSILGDLQGAAAPATQTANADPTAPTGQTEHHHHHHHQDGDGEATGASDVAAASTTAAPSTNDQSVSTIFASDIAQAIQAYGGGSTDPAMPALMA